MRRVTRLSSQRDIATAVVSSDSDSRVTMLAPACDRPDLAPLGVEHLDADPATAGLVGDDAGVRVEPLVVLARRADEQPLVDGVLALEAQDGHADEADALVQADRPRLS
jgi:hypothetical protein